MRNLTFYMDCLNSLVGGVNSRKTNGETAALRFMEVELKELLEDLLKQLGPAPSADALLVEILGATKDGQNPTKILGVKICRARLGLRLKEAKDYYEANIEKDLLRILNGEEELKKIGYGVVDLDLDPNHDAGGDAFIPQT